ncbi:MAG TPA: gliding motility lipoprotein GldH [Chitinophagaceae bacterium]|nr:gliding motility lipoprotein GldH [Chitinophagaceae bacterium]HNU13373.1 gliding motility lipoprotein GldH [Chitinophagaceae bacterium]
MRRNQNIICWLTACSLWFITFSCTTIDLYEKSVTIPGHSWKSDYKPSFTFTIKDTSSPYLLYFVLRHNDKYSFNNLYINLYAKQPGQDSALSVRYDLPLATNEKGWLASGMDDIYEHRILLTPRGQEFYFKKPGDYTFTIEQIMREDPLKNVLNAGLRIEKK